MEKREPSHTVDGNVNCAANMENSIEILLKTKYIATICSSSLTPGHISGQTLIQKGNCIPVCSSTIYNSQNMEATKYPLIDVQIKKMSCLHI